MCSKKIHQNVYFQGDGGLDILDLNPDGVIEIEGEAWGQDDQAELIRKLSQFVTKVGDTFKCLHADCGLISKFRVGIISHLRTHFVSKTYICKICQYSTPDWCILDPHMHNKHLYKNASKKTIEKLFVYSGRRYFCQVKGCKTKHQQHGGIIRHITAHMYQNKYKIKYTRKEWVPACQFLKTSNSDVMEFQI